MKIFITCGLTAIFILLDLLAGNIGLFPAFSVYISLVLVLAYNWSYGIFAAAAAGMVLDVVYGHSLGFLAFVFAAAAGAGALIAERGHRQLISLFGGGGSAGFITAAGVLLTVRFSGGSIPAPDWKSYLIFSVGSGGLWLIILVLIFDFFAKRANLPRCIRSSWTPAGRRLRPVPSRRPTANLRRHSR